MFFKTSKINEFRLWGLLLTLFGMGLMILGTSGLVLWGEKGRFLIYISLIVGLISMALSMGIYFWAGILSTSTVTLECPECSKVTKMLGKTDRCMYCRAKLTFDPKLAQQVPSPTEQEN